MNRPSPSPAQAPAHLSLLVRPPRPEPRAHQARLQTHTPVPLPAPMPGAEPPPADPAEQACRRAWRLLREPAVRALLAQPLRPAPALAAALQDAFHAGRVPGVLIENEVRRALAAGAGDATLLALALLAAVALARFHGGPRALALAAACAERVRAPDAAGVAGAVLRVHALLVLGRGGAAPTAAPAAAPAAALALADAARLDAAARPDVLARGAVLHAGLRMLDGAPLGELLQALETQAAALPAAPAGAPAGAPMPPSTARAQLAGRIALLRSLAGASAAAGVVAEPQAAAASAPSAPDARQFGCWLTCLQAAWLDGDTATARRALSGAAGLAGALTAPSELVPYHLFAALALARLPAARAALKPHRRALQAWARHAPGHAGAPAELARAAELDAQAGARALAAYERAAALARTHGQAWVAALAWEGAADLCARQDLAGALPGYRRLALDAWRDWGAHGRVRRLMQAWDATPAPHADEVRAARADTVGELGLTIAHEVNQPLAAILLHAAAAQRWLRRGQPDAARALDALEQISACGRHAGAIVRSVRDLGRRQGEDASTFGVDAALRDVVQLLRALLQRQDVQLDTRLALPDAQLHASRAQVQQVMMNLLLNASEALAGVDGRARRIELSSCALDGGRALLRVRDNGPGIAPQARARIFDALYSTKPHGTGIGLSLSRAIVEAHGGRIEFTPVEPHGACFCVVLPLARAAAALPCATTRHA